MIKSIFSLATASAVLALVSISPAQAAVDADAAQALFKKNDCTKNMTTSPKVKLDDGTEEEHKAINTKDQAAIKNLANWILAQ